MVINTWWYGVRPRPDYFDLGDPSEVPKFWTTDQAAAEALAANYYGGAADIIKSNVPYARKPT